MSELLEIKYNKFVLENGLEVILYQNFSFPTVAVNIWYKVGSANEHPSKTGFAHLFEHMMFQGSLNVEKEMHFKYIQEAGGSLNGSTSMDRTNYYETLPADSLELALWLESDRMGYLLPALTEEKLENQKSVVMNERRQNYDNQPYGLAWEILFAHLFPEEHPYHWPTIGWMKHIEKFEMNDVTEFFKNFYSPNNASLVVGGNFDIENARKLIDNYFSGIDRGKSVTPIITNEIKIQERKQIIHEDNVQLTRLYFAWHSDKGYGENDAALDILADVLAGSKNGRIHKKLVHDLQIAQDVSAFQYSAKYNGAFFIIITVSPETDYLSVVEKLYESIEEIVATGITNEELTRSINAYSSSYIYSLQNLDTMANQINNYNCYLGEPNSFAFDLERYKELCKEDVQNSLMKYLCKPNVELAIIPKKQ